MPTMTVAWDDMPQTEELWIVTGQMSGLRMARCVLVAVMVDDLGFSDDGRTRYYLDPESVAYSNTPKLYRLGDDAFRSQRAGLERLLQYRSAVEHNARSDIASLRAAIAELERGAS